MCANIKVEAARNDRHNKLNFTTRYIVTSNIKLVHGRYTNTVLLISGHKHKISNTIINTMVNT